MRRSETGFAAALRRWRARRGWSQLELAGRAGVSQRHLSFLELGRAAPSREMAVRLAEALEVGLRERNGFLVAAGFAPIFRETALAAPELAPIREALDFMLAKQEPYPAVVVDRRWNLVKANSGAVRLVEFLLGPLPPEARINLADALVGPGALRPYLVNWGEVARYFLRGIEADAAADGSDETAALLERLLSYEDAAALQKHTSMPSTEPVLSMHFCKGEVSLRLFTAIAILGTPQNVTLDELRIESFFPVDTETAGMFRRWAEA
jgi:transcriptional regulator with XRE-family HTH domain